MTRSDLAVEAIAGGVAAVVTALVSEAVHRLRVPSASPDDGAPHTLPGKAVELIATYLLFRGLMGVTRRVARH